MSGTLWLGAVAYAPKVVEIWEGMRRYLHDEARLALEVVLFQSYEAQVQALLEDRIDIAWNTNLAWLQAERWSDGGCAPLAMRDTDLGWTTRIVALAGGPVAGVEDLRGRTLALGSRDSGHAAILPVHLLASLGLEAGRDYRALRFDTDVGKHGDTGASELEVLKAVLDGRADAGALGSPFWAGAQEQGIFPRGALREVWSSPSYSHCMFTARRALPEEDRRRFVEALLGMRWEDPAHRKVLEAEGLRRWIAADVSGYGSLRDAAERQAFFRRPPAA